MDKNEKNWIYKQIEVYKNALEIAYRKDNKEKIEEYHKELKKLEKLLNG